MNRVMQLTFYKTYLLNDLQVCQKLSSGEGTRGWNNEHKVPYIVNGEEWIGYDDKESVALKVQH